MDDRQERSEERRRPRPEASGKPRQRPDSAEGKQRKRRRPADAEHRKRTGDSERQRRPVDPERRRRSAAPSKRRPESPGARPAEDRRAKPAQKRPPVRAQKRRRSYGLVAAIILILIAVLGAGTAFYWMRYGPSKEKADFNEYYGIENENQLAIIVNNEVLGAQGLLVDGTAYVSYEAVRDHINSRFYWDPNENVLLYTLPTGMISVSVGSSDYMVAKNKQSKDYVILKTEGSQAYIALDFVKEYTDLDYAVYDNPVNRAMIITETGETMIAMVKSDGQVRRLAGVKSPILTEVSKKDKVTVIEDEGDWKKVRTEDGFIGYIKKSELKTEETEVISRQFEEEEFTSISKDYTINMAWHQTTSQTANENILQILASAKGLNTISPTWFTVADNNGNITSLASSDYVNYAHQANVEVWALVDNFGENIDSYELLSHTSSRENLTNQLIAEVLQKNIDGINVDFENISQETGEHFIQFVRELSIKCRQNGIILSVDNYVPGYTSHYNRKEQGIVVDYVIIMGYDEYYSGSYEAGPVASIDYVREGIKSTLVEVPKEKVINAVPFYTRVWSEVPKTEGELADEKGTEAANYTTKVTSQALGMTEAENAVSEAGAAAERDESTQLNFVQWEADGATYKIWLENAKSLEAKLALMKEYELAGTAAWKIGFEKSEIWDVILKYVN